MIIRAKRRTCFYLRGNKVKGENEGHCTASFCDYLHYKELKIKGEDKVPFKLFFEILFLACKLPPFPTKSLSEKPTHFEV